MPNYEEATNSSITPGRRYRFGGIPKALWTAAGLRIGDDTEAAFDLEIANPSIAQILLDSGGGSTQWKFRSNSIASSFELRDDIAATRPFVVEDGAPTHALRIASSGSVGFGTQTPTELLDVNGDAIRIRTSSTPASASASGAAGEIRWDSQYVYVCVATNTWKRAAIATW